MKIIATISKNSFTPDKVAEIVTAGADILRYNFGHSSPEVMVGHILAGKKVLKELKATRVKILVDIPGNKPRLGEFTDGSHKFPKDQQVKFKYSKTPTDPDKFIPFTYEGLAGIMYPGFIITLGDGQLGLEVTKVNNPNSFEAVTLNSWTIGSFKAINIGPQIDLLNQISKNTLTAISLLKDVKPDLIAFSFVKDAAMVRELKSLVIKSSPELAKVEFVAKVETESGIKNLAEILDEVDWLMIARGDLGVCTDIKALGITQQHMIDIAKQKKKKFIIATQIMDSICESFTPQRAEIIDLTNAVNQKADAILLACETGISMTPGYSVKLVREIIKTVEASRL